MVAAGGGGGGPEVGGLMVLFGTHCCRCYRLIVAVVTAAVNTSAADGVDVSSCMHL